MEEIPRTPCILYIAATRFQEVNEIITSEYQLFIVVYDEIFQTIEWEDVVKEAMKMLLIVKIIMMHIIEY